MPPLSHFVGSVLFNGFLVDISAWSMYMSNGEGILTGRDGAVEESL
jgi:hypothetical protein